MADASICRCNLQDCGFSFEKWFDIQQGFIISKSNCRYVIFESDQNAWSFIRNGQDNKRQRLVELVFVTEVDNKKCNIECSSSSPLCCNELH